MVFKRQLKPWNVTVEENQHVVRLCQPATRCRTPHAFWHPSPLGPHVTVVRRLDSMHKQLQGQEDPTGDARRAGKSLRYESTLSENE